MKDRTLEDGTLVLSVYHDLLTTTKAILDGNLREITEYQPTLYCVDPTHLAFLAAYMSDVGYTPPAAPILASYTLCTGIAKRRVLQTFRDVPFVQFVSMSELGWIAMECMHGNMHINDRSFYPEFLRDDEPARPGDLAELVLTSTGGGCLPHIRYRTGDIYRYLGKDCQCGSTFPIARPEGRARNMLLENGRTRLTPKELDDLVGTPDWLEMYKLHQFEEQRFLLEYVSNAKYADGAEDEIVKAIRSHLGGAANLAIERREYIATERSAKFLNCVSSVAERQVDERSIL